MPEQCLRWPCTICGAEPLPGEVEQCTGKMKFMYPRNLDFWCKSLSNLLCTLRIDKLCIFLYNKARNQRSTAEAQMRANPADFKQKGARPMVDMEPAQFGQTVGIRWEAKQRLSTNGMFPPYNKTNQRAGLEHQKCENSTVCQNKSPGNSNRSARGDFPWWGQLHGCTCLNDQKGVTPMY